MCSCLVQSGYRCSHVTLDRPNAILTRTSSASQMNKSDKPPKGFLQEFVTRRLILTHRPVTLANPINASPTVTQSISPLESTMGSQPSRPLLQQFHTRGRHQGGSQAPYHLIDESEKHKRAKPHKERVRKSTYTQTLRTKVSSDGTTWFY